VCAVKKISPTELKFVIYVIIVMMFIFHLFYVVTVVYNGESMCCKVIYQSGMVNRVSNFECV
jgi:hypothetical protein